MSDMITKVMDEVSKLTKESEQLSDIKNILNYSNEQKDGDLVEYVKKWRDAQPLTDMTIYQRLDDIWNVADDVAVECNEMEDEFLSAYNQLDDAVSHEPSGNANAVLETISKLMNDIRTNGAGGGDE